jgi:tRNA (guanine37-N1)-methyltransferase
MQIDILTIFPDMFDAVLNESLIKKAQEKNLAEIGVHDIRSFAEDKHRTVDDTPFGGGGGMVMKLEPLCKALESILDQREEKKQTSIVLTTPQGELFSEEKAKELSLKDHLVIICGHYKGVDERLGRLYPLQEISIGDYVLTGGEIPAMTILDAVVRLIPGVLGDFEFRGLQVPEVLLSGDHERIRRWRKKEALKRTLQRRPDLVNWDVLSDEEKEMLEQIKKEKD